jgi:serine/threonine protein kinase
MSVGKETWGKLSPLLDELLDLPDDERAMRLADLRARDPVLADAVGAMLQHLPAIERGEFMPESALPKPDGLAGQAIGPYTLVREIGHGGMGTVWLARRTDGRYEGEVAIKFLRSGLFGHGDAARFEREGSILARLSHAHIARLLDAGVAADGTQPYLVLEYIDGEPIDQYCQRLALSVPARLGLMLDVLAAVAQAHNRLILHRDLKPTNILVTKAGEVKLLDFGIAKLLDDAGGDAQTALTARAGNAFTPEFAAPEQLQGGDVTPATDVYALGVLMDLLLGGEHPTAAPTGAPLDHMRSVIETEPKRLSEAVLRRGGPTARWSADSRKLSGEVRGDIETIVAKALKKAPTDRYANAAELADDIRRYLAHEPIAARPDSRLYRAGKFVQRYRAGVAMASVAVTALGVGAGVALWQAHEARAQRVQAEGLIEYMIGDLRKKLQPVGRLDILDGVGDKAMAYYAAQDLGSLDADSLGRRARALHLIGDLAIRRGKLEDAQRDFQQAADTTSELLKRYPKDGQRVFDQSQSEFYLGDVARRRGRLHEAEAAFRRYHDLAQRMIRIAPDNLDWRLEAVYAAQDVAIAMIDLGRPEESLLMSEGARTAMAELQRRRPGEADNMGTIVGWIARAQAAMGHDEQAIVTENDKIALARATPGAGKDKNAGFLIADGHLETARWLRNLDHEEEAMRMLRQGLDELTELRKLDPSNTYWLGEMMWYRLLLGDMLADQGDSTGARAALTATEAPLSNLMAQPVTASSWRVVLTGRAATLRARLASTPQDRVAAERALESYLADIRQFVRNGAEVAAEDQTVVGSSELAHGDLLHAAGRETDAQTAWRSAAVWLRPNVERHNPVALTVMGFIDLRLGRIQDARARADTVRGTTYRHPAYADLQQELGQAQ